MLLLILAQVAVAQNPLAVVHPKGDGGPLFSSSDYPAEAYRHGWKGSVVADLTINVNGRVSKCEIVQSSGYAVLDSRTCDILVQRASFYPARDRDKKAVEDVIRTPPINWHP
jgi:protein TonB